MIFIPFHCLQFFVLFKVNSVHIPNLLLFVLVNTSAMHFLCLSFRVSLFGIKRKASLIASSIEHDTLRFCWKTFDYRMIFTDQCDRNSESVGSSYFSCAPPTRVTCASGSPNACLRSPMRRKKLRRFCKQDKAWRDIVGNKLSIRNIFLNIKLPS